MAVTFIPDQQACSVSVDLLREILDFLDDHSDVRDGSYGEPMPNKAMSLMSELLRETGIDL